jgi:hypothetical protein
VTEGATVAAVTWGAQFLGTAGCLHFRNFPVPLRWFTALTAAIGLACSVSGGYWLGAGFCAGTLVLLAWDRWNRKGRKVARLIGEKSRAVLAAVVERAREAGARSPVPQGVPA